MKKILWSIAAVLIIALIILYKPDISAADIEKKYSDSASAFMPILGMKVHYKDEGPRTDSLPLVLIHGTSSSLHTWDSLVNRMRSSKRLIRLDLPAFGLTGGNPSRNYSIDLQVQVIDSLLTKLDIKKAIFAGNSLGGLIAWNAAIKDTNRVKGLVLIDAAGYPRKNEKGNLGFKLASIPGVARLLSKFTPRALIEKSLKDTYTDDNKITDALIDRYYELLLREGNRQATLDIFAQRRNIDPEKIKTIQQPTLIIWGEDDQLIDVHNAFAFKQDIVNSRLLVIPKSGHVPMEENPEEVYRSVQLFLTDFL
jgi:pimeloyl-ACP methyl ester carboxylesterase